MADLISVAELAALQADPHADLVIADASVDLPSPRFDGDHQAHSGRHFFDQAHIPGSIHLDLVAELHDSRADYHFAVPEPADLAARLARRGIGRDTTVVAYDRGDMLWAARLWWTLRWIGLDVRVLDGGLSAWLARYPVASASRPEPGPADPWIPEHPADVWADKAAVAAIAAGTAPGTLICGLSAEAFAGTVASRYRRRGHIPGSVNVPARAHLGPDGLLLPVAALRSAYASITAHPVVLYCGGGISASLNALALTVAGVGGIRIYDGSLEQWAADPEAALQVAG
ncbi:rhodanese-like domain-containing protein [Mycobacterium sp. M26]|uniref:sulfurtransferase n=1 Tax=Mycobacterium sp. M26 TaxID=1762962 RepID=UPI00073F2816|nr:rhodanese-like domain-containing protein [Mycobacterium sp. M26]